MSENKRLFKYIRCLLFGFAIVLSLFTFSLFKVNADNSQNLLNEADYHLELEIIDSNKYRIYYLIDEIDFRKIKDEAEPGTGLLKFGYKLDINNGPSEIFIIDYYSFDLDLFSTQPIQTIDNFYKFSIEKTIPQSSEFNLMNAYYKFVPYLLEDATGLVGVVSNTNYVSNITYMQNQFEIGYAQGFREGKNEGLNASQEEAYSSGRLQGIEEGREQGYKEARADFESDATLWIWEFIKGIQGFLDIKLGSVSIGAIVLIPFGISFAWFVIRQFRGGE